MDSRGEFGRTVRDQIDAKLGEVFLDEIRPLDDRDYVAVDAID